jgi:hypothetical protein
MAAMTGGARRIEKTVDGWKEARPLLEQWRRDLSEVNFELKQPRIIDPVSIDSASGESIEREGSTANRFRGQVLYITDLDLTVRRPSGAMLIIGNNEIVSVSDGKIRFELT